MNKEPGLNVPTAFCITDIRYRRDELRNRIDQKKYYAVRSSSNMEDLAGTSAAGIFDTFLNIRGFEDIEKTIKKCFDAKNKKCNSNQHCRIISLK